MTKKQFKQEPTAIISFACRLPGGNSSPQKLWDFLEQGRVASNEVPRTRFNIKGHYDGSHKPGTMRPKGGIFIEDIDLADFDASFFEIGGTEAIAMDPNQRQMLEVVFEALENAGITLDKLDGAPIACYVGSYASDYGDMQNRDAEDRPANCAIGVGRAIMANRLSYFLNIKGPSITVDTACSGSLVGLDLACRAIQSGEVDAAIVAASNLYLNPDHVMDIGNVGQAHSPSGLCHVFDLDADGYVKAEAVSCVIVKRLSDAIRDRDPIRAIVRGTASNSNGRTGGIASPSSEAQANAIRAAYSNAGITNLNETAYLECHGTGTQAGDPTELQGVGTVFSPTRRAERPLLIGSIKSNVGHSEPAAGNSGLIKIIMSMEKGVIPGTPLFIKPNPKIDFRGHKVKAFRTAVPWPDEGFPLRRASINSFGYGGSNAHAIIEEPSSESRGFFISSHKPEDDEDFFNDEDFSLRPYVLVISANDVYSLKRNIRSLTNHLANPRVKVSMENLAYTLSERRTRHWHRAFLTTSTIEIRELDFTLGKNCGQVVKVALVFTGQGAQWPKMGEELLQNFPWTRKILQELDAVLQSQVDPPQWSLVTELTESRTSEHMRQPELSQSLATALQLCILAVLESWGVKASSVVGHSSGEIAAAYTAGLLDRAGAIKAAFYRGRAARNKNYKTKDDVGMAAVSLSLEAIAPYIEKYSATVSVACYNSPRSLTISGEKTALMSMVQQIKADGHFARILEIELAYHSEFMNEIGEEYESLLISDNEFKPLEGATSGVTMFSSVTGSQNVNAADAPYWKTNMISPVLFSKAFKELVIQDSPNFIIEIGPSGALARPISQILGSLTGGQDISYFASWTRGANASKALFDVAGRLFMAGANIDIARVNEYDINTAKTIIDLPNYHWNHEVKYWHENAASRDWRNKNFITHDLLGSKIPGTSWQAPTWRKHLKLNDVPWLRDHKMGPDVLIPGAGLVTLALEAMYQKYCMLNPDTAVASPNELAYRFRNVNFHRAIVVEETKATTIMLTLAVVPGSKDWHEFRIRTAVESAVYEHCYGLVRIHNSIIDDYAPGSEELSPLRHPQSAKLWYKAQREVGMGFGPAFQKIESIESVNGSRRCRTIVSLEPPASKWEPQSSYPIHPAALDGCLQTATPANAAGERSLIKDTMIPALVEDIVINKIPKTVTRGMSFAESIYTGRGREDVAKSWTANIAIHDPETGAVLMRVRGLNYTRLDVDEKRDPHVFHSVSWKPDVAFMSPENLASLLRTADSAVAIGSVIDLIAFKTPVLRVLEINLNDRDTSTFWFRRGDESTRASYTTYDFATTDVKTLVDVQRATESKRDTSFHLIRLIDGSLQFPGTGPTFDLVIIKAPGEEGELVDTAIKSLEGLLTANAFILLMGTEDPFHLKTLSAIENPIHSSSDIQTPSETSSRSESLSTESITTESTTGIVLVDYRNNTERNLWEANELHVTPAYRSFSAIAEIPDVENRRPTLLLHNAVYCGSGMKLPNITVALFRNFDSVELKNLQVILRSYGLNLNTLPIEEVSANNISCSTILVLDELIEPVLTNISEEHWRALKQVIATGKSVLWVTKGSQMENVTEPNNAAVHGLFRVIRREDPQARLATLDVESAAAFSTPWAIQQVLRKLSFGAGAETEYAERGGIIYLQRVRPDTKINDFKAAENGKGLKPIVQSLRESKVQIRLQAEKVGALQSLMWCETSDGDVPMAPGMVEIEVMAVGVNFKDVATTMGIVPENEHTIGCECAGYVKRIAPGLKTSLKVGDRVAAMRSGTYVNHLQCPYERVHVIPNSMSFVDAVTIPLVYLTAIYSLYHLGNLKEGQSVLIHSAAGGVGIAAIQLAQYKKCDIFVTVGTDEKRSFLANNFGIPKDRIFNSRNIKFADEIRRKTGGRGIDVILNSLIGELLDESWRLTADGGTMVEIGKRDIVNRNTLAMEPFDRNCSFRAVDLSYVREISNELIGKLLAEIFDLIKGGHIGPIHPVTVYRFDQVIEALTCIRRGQHIGKIVVTRADEEDIQLQVRPKIPKLHLDHTAAYIIVGGLKGLCGSLAVHMARHGARQIIVISRSGIKDDASTRIIENCAAHGCQITDASGDVGCLEFVRTVFQNARPKRIAGIIQGAMVLKDKPYETMTHDDYHITLYPKIAGTWNLHNAALSEQTEPLDFFTMLSSISSVVGNKGQANYAAANSFLDAFARYRLARGLRAHTVNLGVIEDVGYVAEQGGGLELRFDKRQWTPINEGMLRRILTYSVFQQSSSPLNAASIGQLITGLAYPLVARNSDLAEEPRFGYLFSGADSQENTGEESEEGDDQIAQAIRVFGAMHTSGADTIALEKAALSLLTDQTAKLLRLETEMEPGKPLMAYGLDSLAAVELRGWVRQKLGAELSTLDITNANSLYDLSAKLVSKLPVIIKD
ncbi:putative polyketide synthase [Xylaria cf. heliscus]|nr:putative polyketide synthase [Xylaria cf. heliscus]